MADKSFALVLELSLFVRDPPTNLSAMQDQLPFPVIGAQVRTFLHLNSILKHPVAQRVSQWVVSFQS
jgi:hypothetical protein